MFESSAEKMNDYFFQSQSYFCQPRRTNERNFRSSLIILMTRRIYENSRIILIRLQALNISLKFSTPKELSDRIERGERKKKKKNVDTICKVGQFMTFGTDSHSGPLWDSTRWHYLSSLTSKQKRLTRHRFDLTHPVIRHLYFSHQNLLYTIAS